MEANKTDIQESQNVLEEPGVSVEQQENPNQEIATEELRKQLADKDRQIQDLGSKYSTLEKIVLESRNNQRSEPMPRNDFNYEGALKESLEKAVNDGDIDTASRKMKDLMARSNYEITNNLSNQFKAYLQIKDNVSQVLQKKPHLKGFQEDYESRISQYIQAGNDVKSSLEAVEREFDQKFQGVLANTQKVNEPMKNDPVKNNPSVTMGNISQQPLSHPNPAPKTMTAQEYLDYRKAKQAGQFFNLRDKK